MALCSAWAEWCERNSNTFFVCVSRTVRETQTKKGLLFLPHHSAQHIFRFSAAMREKLKLPVTTTSSQTTTSLCM
jgi:hypothetical protein